MRKIYCSYRLFSTEFMCKCNLKGNNSKHPFEKTKVYKAIIGNCYFFFSTKKDIVCVLLFNTKATKVFTACLN